MLRTAEVRHVYARDPHSEGSMAHSPSQRFSRKLNVRPDSQAHDLQVHNKTRVCVKNERIKNVFLTLV